MKKSLSIGFCAAIASLAMSSSAWALLEVDTGGSLGANGWTVPAVFLSFSSADAGTNSNGGNMFYFEGIMNNPQVGLCLELQTFPAGGTTNPDTRLFVNNGGTPLSVNDDFGGTLQSKAHYWIIPAAGNSLDWTTFVGAYSSADNAQTFNLKYSRLDVTEAACTTGQTTIPWAKIKGTGVGNNVTITLSSNAS